MAPPCLPMEPTLQHVGNELPQADAEAALRPLLDAFERQEYSESDLSTNLAAICAQQPAATWQALSLLDRYHRRQILSSAQFRGLKQTLNAIAFGSGSREALNAPDTQRDRFKTAGFNSAATASRNNIIRNEDITATRRDPTASYRAEPAADTVDFAEVASDGIANVDSASVDIASVDIASVDIASVDIASVDMAFDAAAPLESDPTASHLPGEDVSGTTLPRALRVQQTLLIKTTLEASPSLRPGLLLQDRYVLIEPLSSGGIGVVFKALDRQRAALPESERYVAVKCLHERLQNESHAIAVLRHEYLQSTELSHPNIARVYDFQEGGSICFLALELTAGESLSRICERIVPRRLPHSRALAIVREIGSALAHAHEHGVVHGNLHPGNVVITRSGDIRVHEFGQAAAWLASIDSSSVHHDIKPSPRELLYISPQQKSAIPADAADDIYSLASIAHELLCGCPPELRRDEAATGKRPRYAPHLAARQWHALQRGLAEDRAQRGDDVRKWLADLDLSAAEIRLPNLAVLELEVADPARVRRIRWQVGAAALATLALLVLGFGWWAASEKSPTQTVGEQSAKDSIHRTGIEATAPPLSPAENQSAAELAAGTRVTDATPNVDPIIGRDDAVTLPTVSFTQTRYQVGPKDSTAKLVIRRVGSSDRPLTLQLLATKGSAKPSIDYAAEWNHTVQMNAGQKSVEVEIPLVEGRQRARAVSFSVRIRATTAALPGQAVSATVYLMPANAAAK